MALSIGDSLPRPLLFSGLPSQERMGCAADRVDDEVGSSYLFSTRRSLLIKSFTFSLFPWKSRRFGHVVNELCLTKDGEGQNARDCNGYTGNREASTGRESFNK